jgi:hypothetical protein
MQEVKRRFRRTRYSVVNNKRYIEKFRDEWPEYKDMTRQEFSKIINTFNELCVVNQIVNNRHGVLLPQKLGHLFIALYNVNINKKIINYSETKKQGRNVYFHNFETDGKIGKLKYVNKSESMLVTDLKVWSFTGSAELRRRISKAIVSNFKLYETHDNSRRGSIKGKGYI